MHGPLNNKMIVKYIFIYICKTGLVKIWETYYNFLNKSTVVPWWLFVPNAAS
jgi:hypothetical protein